MFDIFKIILSVVVGFPFIFWLISSGSGWQELAERYETDLSVPDTFYLESNQKIIFKHETINASSSLAKLGIGVLNDGLYLTKAAIPFISDRLFPPLLIPWTDISYRKSSSSAYFTFYLGNPRITRFSINPTAIEILEADYGEPIFLSKLGEPD